MSCWFSGRSVGVAAVGPDDRSGDEADVGVVEVAQAAGEVDGDAVVGEAGGDPHQADRRSGGADPVSVYGGDDLVPVDVGVGLPVGVDAGGDVAVDEGGVGEPVAVSADQLVGGAAGGQPAGVGDQRSGEVVGVGEGHRSPRFVVVPAGRHDPYCPSVPAVLAAPVVPGACRARTLPVPAGPAAAAVRRRWISSCWAVRRDSARVRWSCRAVMAWSWPAQRVFSAAFSAFSLAIWASRGSGGAAGRGRSGHVAFELLFEVRVGAVEGRAGHAGPAGQGGDVAAAAVGDVAGQQRGRGGADALLGLLPLVVGDGHGTHPPSAGAGGSVWAASMASTTRWARSTSACRRACSVLRVRPGMPRNTVPLATVPAHTSRCRRWWVACGQRAESHMPISGASASVRPARIRHSARLGSTNQQKFPAEMCRTLARLDSRFSRCWSPPATFGAAAAILACAPPGREAYPSVVAALTCFRWTFAASSPPGR